MLFLLEILSQFYTPNRLNPNGNRITPSVNKIMIDNRKRITTPTKNEQIDQIIIDRKNFLNNVNRPI